MSTQEEIRWNLDAYSPPSNAFAHQASLVSETGSQPYDFLVAISATATSLPSEPTSDVLTQPEMIELAASALHVASNQVIGAFHRYVKPVRASDMSRLCALMTGIDAGETIAKAKRFDDVFDDLCAWLEQCGLSSGVVKRRVEASRRQRNDDGDDGEGKDNDDRQQQQTKNSNYALVVDGDDYFPRLLRDQCNLVAGGTSKSGPLPPEPFRSYVDARSMFFAAFPNVQLPEGVGSAVSAMLAFLSIRFEGRAFVAADEQKNMTTLLSALIKRGVRIPVKKTRADLFPVAASNNNNNNNNNGQWPRPEKSTTRRGGGGGGDHNGNDRNDDRSGWKPGDWSCEVCRSRGLDHQVYASKTRCGQCGTDKSSNTAGRGGGGGGRRRSPSRDSGRDDQKNLPPPPHNVKPGDWCCLRCARQGRGCWVYATKNRCHTCGTEKPPAYSTTVYYSREQDRPPAPQQRGSNRGDGGRRGGGGGAGGGGGGRRRHDDDSYSDSDSDVDDERRRGGRRGGGGGGGRRRSPSRGRSDDDDQKNLPAPPRNVKPGDWCCLRCARQGRGCWVYATKNRCHTCGTDKPPAHSMTVYYSRSEDRPKPPRGGGGGGGGDGGRRRGGGGGGGGGRSNDNGGNREW